MKKIFLTLISIILLAVFAFVAKETIYNDVKSNDNKQTNNNEKNSSTFKPEIDYTKYITETSESNKNKVKEFISKGMSLEEFKTTLSKIPNYVDKSGTYQQINYDFENHLKYNSLEEIYLNLNNSEIVKLEIIGNSYDDKNIYSLEIGNGEDAILLNGNIHSAEIAPTLFLTKYAIDLVNNWEEGDKETKELLTNHKIIIIPTINPDGYNFSIYGKSTINNQKAYTYLNASDIDKFFYKANANGVDLNRNLPSQTSGLYFTDRGLYSSTSKTKSTEMYAYFPGNSVGSEPETQAIIYWMYKHYKNAHAFIDVHSAGRVIYSQKQWLSDRFNELGKKCANTINKYTDYQIIPVEPEDDGRGTDGGTTDMIGEIAHGYKFSTITGRLSAEEYEMQANIMESELCAITVETLTNYTQNLSTIKNEYYDKRLSEAFTSIAELNF